MITHIDLFSGIGAFALAAKRSNIKTIQFVEIDPFCQFILKKQFQGVSIHDDIKTYTGESPCDIITGGFPCQDVASINKFGTGLEGTRSGLWFEMFRIINKAKPKFVVIENVRDIRNRSIGIILENLSSIGYNAEWHTIVASDFGSPHERERIFIIAYSNSIAGLQTDSLIIPDGVEWQKRYSLNWENWGNFSESDWAISKSAPCRMVNGLSSWLDEHKARHIALGNSILPQICEEIFRNIIPYVLKEQES